MFFILKSFERLLFLPKHFLVEIRTVYLDMQYCNLVKLSYICLQYPTCKMFTSSFSIV